MTPLKVCPSCCGSENSFRKEAQVTFQVVEGVNENIISVNRALDVGASVQTDNCFFQWQMAASPRSGEKGDRFLLPYEELMAERAR